MKPASRPYGSSQLSRGAKRPQGSMERAPRIPQVLWALWEGGEASTNWSQGAEGSWETELLGVGGVESRVWGDCGEACSYKCL